MGEIGCSGLQPRGFPRRCWRCPCLGSKDVAICLDCSTGRLTARAAAPSCPVCDQALGAAERCSNDWCTRAYCGSRWCGRLPPMSRAWRSVIRAYKYGPEMRWRVVLGRILVAYLDEHMPWFDDYDMLVPMPAFVGPEARRHWDPVGQVVAVAAALAGPRWDFAPGLVVKEFETPALAGLSRPARRTCAEGAGPCESPCVSPTRRRCVVAGSW